MTTTTTTINTNHPAHKLLSRAHPDHETATKIFTDKIIHKPLLLNPSTDHIQTNARTAHRHLRLHKKAYALKRARPKPLSAKEKRSLKLYDLKPAECRYEIYNGLNQLWRRYILEVLGYLDREGRVVQSRIGQPANTNSSGALIASADFHGMEIEVVACTDQTRIGCKGIIIRETRSTLTIVCNQKEHSKAKLKLKRYANNEAQAQVQSQDKVRMILKRGAVFRVTVTLPTNRENETNNTLQSEPPQPKHTAETSATVESVPESKRQLIFELHGDNLEIRPTERAVKKFKWKPTDYL